MVRISEIYAEIDNTMCPLSSATKFLERPLRLIGYDVYGGKWQRTHHRTRESAEREPALRPAMESKFPELK